MPHRPSRLMAPSIAPKILQNSCLGISNKNEFQVLLLQSAISPCHIREFSGTCWAPRQEKSTELGGVPIPNWKCLTTYWVGSVCEKYTSMFRIQSLTRGVRFRGPVRLKIAKKYNMLILLLMLIIDILPFVPYELDRGNYWYTVGHGESDSWPYSRLLRDPGHARDFPDRLRDYCWTVPGQFRDFLGCPLTNSANNKMLLKIKMAKLEFGECSQRENRITREVCDAVVSRKSIWDRFRSFRSHIVMLDKSPVLNLPQTHVTWPIPMPKFHEKPRATPLHHPPFTRQPKTSPRLQYFSESHLCWRKTVSWRPGFSRLCRYHRLTNFATWPDDFRGVWGTFSWPNLRGLTIFATLFGTFSWQMTWLFRSLFANCLLGHVSECLVDCWTLLALPLIPKMVLL